MLVVRLIFDVSVRGRKHLEISGWVETEPGYQVGGRGIEDVLEDRGAGQEITSNQESTYPTMILLIC